jgi:hypothetical protein
MCTIKNEAQTVPVSERLLELIHPRVQKVATMEMDDAEVLNTAALGGRAKKGTIYSGSCFTHLSDAMHSGRKGYQENRGALLEVRDGQTIIQAGDER